MQHSFKSGAVFRRFFPTWQGELFLPLALVLLSFCVCFNYTLLRNVKEALIVTANDGALVLPFIKVWAILPTVALMMGLFTFLARRYRQESLFQGIVGGFMLFFLLFLYVLYPARALLYPATLVEWLHMHLPLSAASAIGIIGHWPLTFFYVIAELWGVIVLSVLFWGLVNLLIPLSEARLLYPLLNISGHCGCMLAGQIPFFIRKMPSDQVLALLIGCALVAGFCIMWLLRHLYRIPQVSVLASMPFSKQGAKNAPSMYQSLRIVMRLPALQAIAIMVAGYSMLIYTTEVFWKDSLQQLYPDFRDYNAYVGNISTYVSIVSIPMAFLVPWLLRFFGWKKVALIPPVLLSISSALFCLSFLYTLTLSGTGRFELGSGAFDLLMSCGSLHMTLALSCKYALFDPTKEMAFIPLEPERKWIGKAAIDGVGTRLTQSMSCLIMQGAIMLCGSLAACAPYLFPFLFFILVLWIRAVYALGEQFPALDAVERRESKST